jgi:hypothetical protein
MLRELVCFAVLSLVAVARPPEIPAAIPGTPAGGVFKAWLDAFNSGDRKAMESYFQKHEPGKMDNLDRMVELRGMSGGFELIAIDKSEPLHIEFRVKEKDSDTLAAGHLDVASGDPAMVKGFSLRAGGPGPAGNAAPAAPIDAAERARVIDRATALLNEFYVFPEIAQKMEESVKARQALGEYGAVTSGEAFAEMLTEHFQAISHDKHLHVNYSAGVLPEGEPGEGPEDQAEYRKRMERINCGFETAERLSGNIGYLKFNMFADPKVCGATAAAAMNFLENVDAIIFDVRSNGGGEPSMVALLTSYLFGSEPVHLNDLWNRKTNMTQQYWTLPYVPGKRLEGKPVFVLTSKRTFSGAEEFSYNLKNLKRATLVGETTGGGAHPVSDHRIDDHFMIGVPFARAINPISKTNWEGKGVEPDVKVPAQDALATARKLAAQASR